MTPGVYNRDCQEAMKEFPDKFFDLAIVDPPYGIGLANMSMGVGKSKKASKKENRKWIPKDWDAATPDENYFQELFRVSKNQIIWGGNYFNLPPCYGYVIWDKKMTPGVSFADCEMAWHSFKYVARIFRHSVFIGNDNKIHPTQKPIALYNWLLNNYANPGDKILDTHLGSGSHRIAAHRLGFDFWGYELDKDYFDDQEVRFRKECHGEVLTKLGTVIKQPSLFK